MDAVELIRVQAELEYGVTVADGIIPVTAANAADVPLVSVARHANGAVVYCRGDLPGDLRDRLVALGGGVLFAERDRVCASLSVVTSDVRMVDCRWYAFARISSPVEFPDATERDGRFVIVRDGEIVAAARSACENVTAAEVEVETTPAFRQRGYGRQVIAAWAYHTVRTGKVAFYSHRWHNTASEALARSVGATWYADTIEYVRH